MEEKNLVEGSRNFPRSPFHVTVDAPLRCILISTKVASELPFAVRNHVRAEKLLGSVGTAANLTNRRLLLMLVFPVSAES